MTATIRRVGPGEVAAEDAAAVLAVVRTAFEARPVLDPPTEALAETEESLREALARGGGLVAELHGRPVGALLLDRDGDLLWLRRFGVVPEARGHGVARALVAAALAAEDVPEVAVLAREELPGPLRFWQGQGFVETRRATPYVELRRPLWTAYDAPDAAAMRALGERLAADLRAGDLVVLSGGLGAGKTTLTQGLGAGLGVRGDVTSPTFVIARVHPSLSDGPPLVHVDAYRLGGAAELDDLDLDASLDDAVTVVEWGEGLAEGLAESRVEIRIERFTGADLADAPTDHDPRVVRVRRLGPRWAGPRG